jgi:hypothetical protein
VPIPYPVQENPEEAPFFPATIVAVNVRSHKILHTDDAQMHDYEGLDKLLNGLVRGFIDIGVCPKSITVCDNESHALLSDFCEKCKIMLVKARSFKILDGIVSDFYDNLDDEHDMDSGEINAEMLASITNTLMEMPDDVLRTMPNDLVQLIFSLIEDGVVSPELTQKFRRVFGLFS